MASIRIAGSGQSTVAEIACEHCGKVLTDKSPAALYGVYARHLEAEHPQVPVWNNKAGVLPRKDRCGGLWGMPCGNRADWINENGVICCDSHKVLIEAFNWELRNKLPWRPL